MKKLTKLAFAAAVMSASMSFAATSTLNALKGSDTVVTEEADAAALEAIAALDNTYATDAELTAAVGAAATAATNYTDSAITALDLANTYEAKGTAASLIQAADLGQYATTNWCNTTFAAKATTLAGYGITDAKIEGGVITLGSATITPLTAHQDISGKVNQSDVNTAVGDLADLADDPTFQAVVQKLAAVVDVLQALKTN